MFLLFRSWGLKDQTEEYSLKHFSSDFQHWYIRSFVVTAVHPINLIQITTAAWNLFTLEAHNVLYIYALPNYFIVVRYVYHHYWNSLKTREEVEREIKHRYLWQTMVIVSRQPWNEYKLLHKLHESSLENIICKKMTF